MLCLDSMRLYTEGCCSMLVVWDVAATFTPVKPLLEDMGDGGKSTSVWWLAILLFQ